jgi:hypothetical protein
MIVVRAVLFALAVAGCATSSGQERLRASCEQDVTSDPRCLEVLTANEEEYESRAEVLAAEERREARAFDERLLRLRREEEERQATRAKTSTASEMEEEEPEEVSEEAEDLADAEISKPGALEVGSSVRALEAPTPESYLRGARCILTADLAETRKAFEEGKRAGKQARAGELAVVILDTEALVGRIDGEMKHRRLPLQDGECKQHGGVIELLRSLVGPRVDQRALVRLVKELELRAGLPKAE